jgi:hypothetical protein
MGDKAYSSGTDRELLRQGIRAVILDPAGQSGRRKRRGSRGGRPVNFDAVTCKAVTLWKDPSVSSKNGAAPAKTASH